MRRVETYIKGGAIYVVALAGTPRGYTVKTGNVRVLPREVESTALGTAVLAALDDYKSDWPELTDPPKQHAKLMLRTLGYTSLRRFERGTRYIGVQAQHGMALVIPTKPYGRGGYLGLTKQDLPDSGLVRCNLEPLALGEAIKSRILVSIPHPE